MGTEVLYWTSRICSAGTAGLAITGGRPSSSPPPSDRSTVLYSKYTRTTIIRSVLLLYCTVQTVEIERLSRSQCCLQFSPLTPPKVCPCQTSPLTPALSILKLGFPHRGDLLVAADTLPSVLVSPISLQTSQLVDPTPKARSKISLGAHQLRSNITTHNQISLPPYCDQVIIPPPDDHRKERLVSEKLHMGHRKP